VTPTAICVLGPGRSGTSLTAAILDAIGVYLGTEEELVPAGKGNPKGNWEHRRIMLLNERLLRAQREDDEAPPHLPPGWESSASLESEREEARTLIAESFGGQRLWGWKDPKCSLTLPFWQQLVPRMRYAICVRNPLDVVASAKERRALGGQRAFFAWFRHMARALVNTSGQPRVLVPYEAYFSNLDGMVANLAHLAGRTPPGEVARRKLAELADEQLWHHRASLDDLLRDARVPADVKALYVTVQILSTTEPTNDEGDSSAHLLADSFAKRLLDERGA